MMAGVMTQMLTRAVTLPYPFVPLPSMAHPLLVLLAMFKSESVSTRA